MQDVSLAHNLFIHAINVLQNAETINKIKGYSYNRNATKNTRKNEVL